MNERSDRPIDPFILNYQPRELEIASEFLSTWLPFLSRGLCHHCTNTLSDRIRSLEPALKSDSKPGILDEKSKASTSNNVELEEEVNDKHDDSCDVNSLGSWKDGATGSSEPVLETSINESSLGSPHIETPRPRMSWADMAQEDELEEEEEEEEEEEGEDDDYEDNESSKRMVNINNSTGELRISKVVEKPKLSREQRECIRFMNVMRKKDFICLERFKGKIVNILDGLELHEGIFSAVEQKRIVDYIYMLQEKGKKGELKG